MKTREPERAEAPTKSSEKSEAIAWVNLLDFSQPALPWNQVPTCRFKLGDLAAIARCISAWQSRGQTTSVGTHPATRSCTGPRTFDLPSGADERRYEV